MDINRNLIPNQIPLRYSAIFFKTGSDNLEKCEIDSESISRYHINRDRTNEHEGFINLHFMLEYCYDV